MSSKTSKTSKISDEADVIKFFTKGTKPTNKVQVLSESNKNTILELKKSSKTFFDDDSVIIQELREGEAVEIWWDSSNKTWLHTEMKNSSQKLYIENITTEKLSKIVDKYFGLTVHFYGVTSRDGFRGYDIFVNSNYLDSDRVVADLQEVGVKTLEEFYRGAFSDVVIPNGLFLIRSEFEQPAKRLIAYTKKIDKKK